MKARCEHCGRTFAQEVDECESCGSHAIVVDGSPPASARARRSAPTPVLVVLLVVLAGSAVVFFLATPLFYGAYVFAPRRPAPRATVAASADGFAALKAQGKLRVAADPNAPPFLSGGPGAWEGFEYALAAAIADAAGVPLEIVPADFDALDDEVRAGDADLAIGQIPPRPDAGVAFTRSYLQYSLCLVVGADSPAQGITDLRGKTIGSYADQAVTDAIRASLGQDWTHRAYDDYGYFDDLAHKRIDAVVYDCPLVRYELGRASGPAAAARIVDADLAVATYSVAVASDRPELRADVDRVLGELGNQGLLQQLAQRWLGETTPLATARYATVQTGETLHDVALRALGDVQRAGELASWNEDILGGNPEAVYAGMRLRLR